MQTFIVFTFWVFASVLLQTTALPNFPSQTIWTDYLFYLIIILGIKYNYVTGFSLAILFGYIADTISFSPHGVALISYILTLIFIRKVRENIYLESKQSLFFWIVIFSIVKQLSQLFMLKLNMDIFSINANCILNTVLQSLWDACIGLFIIEFLNKLLFTDWGMVFSKKGLRD